MGIIHVQGSTPWAALGMLTTVLGLGCVSSAHSTVRPSPAYGPAVSPPTATLAPYTATPQTRSPYAAPPPSHPAAPAQGPAATDFRPEFSLSPAGERRAAFVRPQDLPAPTSTVAPSGKPALSAELRTGLAPSVQSPTLPTFERLIKDRGRYTECGLPETTRVDVSAIIYDGSTTSAAATTTPNNAAMDACISRAVQAISWPRELLVRQIKVAF